MNIITRAFKPWDEKVRCLFKLFMNIYEAMLETPVVNMDTSVDKPYKESHNLHMNV